MAQHQQTVSEVRENRLSTKTKIIFGMGDYLNTVTYGMIGAFLMAFLTDVSLVPIGAVTAILSLSKLWDAINDPIIGVLIDKSRSPQGVYRPWLTRMSIPFAVSNVLLWVPIAGWGDTAKIAYVATIYCLYFVFFTAYHIAYGSLGGTMTQNTDDRGKLYGYRLGTSQLLYWLLTVLWLPFIGVLMNSGMTMNMAYFVAAAVFTLPGIIFAFLLYKNSTEVVAPPESTKLPANLLVQFIIKNPALMMCMLGQFVYGIYSYGRQNVMLYYFTYNAGDQSLYTLYSFISIGCGILGPATAPFLMEKIGNKGKVAGISFILSGAAMVGTHWTNPADSAVLFYVLAACAGYFNGMISAAIYACMLDTIEVGLLKTGIRVSAFAVSLCHFGNKLGMTLSIAGVGALLAVEGFVANQQQNAAVLGWIDTFFTWLPGIIGIAIGLIFLFGYKLTREKYYQVLAQLKHEN